MSATTALQRLADWPRLPLAHLPTPFRPMLRLPGALGAPELDMYVKLDAETGFALGGNKVRKLEFELAADRVKGVTCLLTAGGPQSNHCRVTSAAAAWLGLRCILVVTGPEPDRPTGNALLHRLFGAEIITVAERVDRSPRLKLAAEEVAAGGGHPLVIPIGASTGLGSLGYARAAVELLAQTDAIGNARDRTVIVVASSSCGTLAGLLTGISLLGREDVCLIGVSADASAAEIESRAAEIARKSATLLGWDGDLLTRQLSGVDSQVGEGYGIPTDASKTAVQIFGQTEGLVLDPTYTSKAGAGLIELIRSGEVTDRDRVVFLHTGGHPGLLA
jgi:1-aminocyclopropane-1-carboxylate deaminase/D-cysteine desulfhydrase-like pyridoxal-dependent ACC family enzyme